MENISIYDIIYPKYKIKNEIRLIELFAGIGSQAKALERLKVKFVHYKVIKFDKYAIKSYNAIHGTNFKTSDITKTKANDLEIVHTDKYDYIMTYSFPCQDLSLAGKQRGMSKGSGTRSGLLWEVERLLDECEELPQILLMENVPEVIGQKNIEDFQKWQLKLESLGYSNYVQILNAKDYGIPQNGRRCFMISILGKYNYTFPKKIKLKLFLKDMLEENVDEKYYLSKKMINCFTSKGTGKFPRSERFYQSLNKVNKENIANTIITTEGTKPTCNFIIIPEATKKGYAKAYDGDGVYINRPHQKRGVVQKGMIQTLKTSCNDVGVVVKNNLKTKLCNDLIKNGLVKENDVIRHSYSNSRIKEWDKRSVEFNNISATLDTRCDCLGVCVNENNYLRIRKLTPLECYRLMGFDDQDYIKASSLNSNAQLYKQAGNSIVVNVLYYIFKQLI